jgi:hypothetical protein
LIGFVLLACGGAAPETEVKPLPLHEQELVSLEAPRLLRRMSLDLRGVLPSVEDLNEVEANPAALEQIWPNYLTEPNFEERLVELFAEQWLTRVDGFNVSIEDYFLASSLQSEFVRSVGEEPMRILARVATTDRPWTDVATWDHTMANSMLEKVWPLEREEGDGWQPARWVDGRPAAGVLSSNGLWWRYYTTPFNYNRTRAAAVSKLLLCEDYLERPVAFSSAPSILDEEGTEDAIRNVEACKSCHSTLDPIASALFGFWWFELYDPAEMEHYHPDREPMGELELGVKPGFVGQPLQGLQDLGQAISEDPRLVECAVEQSFIAFMRRQPTLHDFGRLQRLKSAFVAGELRYLELMTALLQEPAYRIGTFSAEASSATRERENVDRLLSPAQWERAVEDLTGFLWTEDDWDHLRNDGFGYRVLMGGVDGDGVDSPATSLSVSMLLVIKRLAQQAAYHVVQRDLVKDDDETLLHRDWLELSDEDDLKDAIGELHWRLVARRASQDDLEALMSLFWSVEAESNAASAWQSVLTVLFRGSDFVSY